MQFKHHLLITSIYAALIAAQSLPNLPACASPAALAAIGSSGCSATDIPCLCKSDTFISSLTQSAKSNCTEQEYESVVSMGQTFCAQAGVTVNSNSQSGQSVTTIPTTDAGGDAATATSAAVSMSTADILMANRTVVTTTRCSCSEVTETSSAPVSIATYTGAAVKAGVNVGFGVAGVVGLFALF